MLSILPGAGSVAGTGRTKPSRSSLATAEFDRNYAHAHAWRAIALGGKTSQVEIDSVAERIVTLYDLGVVKKTSIILQP